MPVRQIIPPDPVEPISLEQAKMALRVDHTDDDEILPSYIVAAREFVEKRIQAKVAQQTWEYTRDDFPDDDIELPFGPVSSIVSIKYDDENGDEQTLDPFTYGLYGERVSAVDVWPATSGNFNSVRIQFVAGYSDATLIPQPVWAAMILKLKELYDGENTAEAVHNLLTNYYQMVA